MTKQEFREFYQNKLIYLDGATGSNLQKAGMPTGVCPEQWILEHPDAILELQRAFVEAGTNILYAPTFTANRIKLAEYGLAEHLIDMNTELVRLAKQAAGGKALVAGDITMTGRQLTPMGDMDFEQLIDVYKEQIRVLDQAGVDLLVVETMMSLQECRAAVLAIREVCDLPVMVSLTYNEDGRTLYGTDPVTAVVVMHGSGKLKTLMVFPSIFKGEHISHTEMVEVLTGKEITVRFDSPAALQIDGETVKNVSEYSVKAYDRENGDRRYTDGEKEKESETV